MRYTLYNIPHTYVYRRSLYLNSGSQYVFETRDLDDNTWNFGNTADTYMYLVRGDNIVAKNDDHNGLASLIAYRPTVSGHYYLFIRAYSKYSNGTCDVYQTTDNGSQQKLDNNVKFGGYPISARWRSDERLETTNASGDTYLYLISGNKFLKNDDSGEGYCSLINPNFAGTGLVVVGSWSQNSEGNTWVSNFYMSYLDNPGRDLLDDPALIITPNMEKYRTELHVVKPKIEGLSHGDREEEVVGLQKKVLTKEERESFGARRIKPPSEEYIKAFHEYTEILNGKKSQIAKLNLPEQINQMKRMSAIKREIFRGHIPLDE
jgi:hypothetical protein